MPISRPYGLEIICVLCYGISTVISRPYGLEIWSMDRDPLSCNKKSLPDSPNIYPSFPPCTLWCSWCQVFTSCPSSCVTIRVFLSRFSLSLSVLKVCHCRGTHLGRFTVSQQAGSHDQFFARLLNFKRCMCRVQIHSRTHFRPSFPALALLLPSFSANGPNI